MSFKYISPFLCHTHTHPLTLLTHTHCHSALHDHRNKLLADVFYASSMLDNIHQEGLQLEALELQGYMRGKGGATGAHARGGGSYRGTCGGRGELQGHMRREGGDTQAMCFSG